MLLSLPLLISLNTEGNSWILHLPICRTFAEQVLDDVSVRDEPVGNGGYPLLCDGHGYPRTGGVDGHHGRLRGSW